MIGAGNVSDKFLPHLAKAQKGFTALPTQKINPSFRGEPCYECGGSVKRYDVGGFYDCPDQEKDPVTGKCKAEVVRGREAAAANKAAVSDMNAWAKQVAAMDKEVAKQNAAQAAGQLTFDYDWMQSPVDKADKKASIAASRQFFQQNPNVFVADDTSGYSPEQKYIIASKLKQRMSTPMGSKLVQQKYGVDPKFYDLQRIQSDFAPKMGGWDGMRNFLFNVYKQNGGSTTQNAFTLPEVVVVGGKDRPTVNTYQKETDKLIYSDSDPYYGIDEYANHYAKMQIAKQYGVPKVRPAKPLSAIKSFMRNRSGVKSDSITSNPSYMPISKTTYADFNDGYVKEYLPELSHYVSQNRQGTINYNKGRVLDAFEYLKGNNPYEVKGTEENYAHRVIQPELTQAYMNKFMEGRDMAMSAAASSIERNKLQQKKQQGGIIEDSRGQWAHPGQVTRIPGSDITMQGVPYPVYGVGSNGQEQMMYPGQEYDFGGASYVDEYPMMQFGGGTLLGPAPVMSKIVPGIINMFSGNPLKKFIKWVNEPSETTSSSSVSSSAPVKVPVRTYGYDDTYQQYYDRAQEVYDKLDANDDKPYNSSKAISLSSGRFAGAKVDPEMINDIVKAAKDNNVDPWLMLSLVGRESTFGSGAWQNKLRSGSKQDLVSGWNVAEEYMPYEFNRFLADKQVPGIKVHKDYHGWNYQVVDEKAVDNYLKKNPQLIDSYYKKIESTPDLGALDSFALAAQRIKKKGIQNYNPGDPKYPSMVNEDMNLLKNDAALKAYMKSKGYKYGGVVKMKNGGQHGGLDRWFAEKWVDVKTGKACGRQEGEKRAGYPACRPSKRVNSQTPKTSSEMSSAEKAKFKASKTSSQRINYNHKRNK